MVAVPSTMLPLGTRAPSFRLEDFNSRTKDKSAEIALDDYEGYDAYLILFICNHCPYVKHLRDTLAVLGKDYQEKNVAIFAINSNDVENYPDDHPDKMAEEAEAAGYPFPYLYDPTQAVAKAYRAACTPDFFLFNHEKRLMYRGQFDATRPGSQTPPTGEDLRAALNAVLTLAKQMPSMGCNIKWKPGNEPDYFQKGGPRELKPDSGRQERPAIDYVQRLIDLEKLAKPLPEQEMNRLVESGWLDEYFGNILEAIEWLQKMQRLHPSPEPLTTLQDKLQARKQSILKFYQTYFTTHAVLGNRKAAEKPDFLFILACLGSETLQKRVEGALPYIERHPDAHVVLCGGGFDPVLTEVQRMRAFLADHPLPASRLTSEEDSLDTIGNAVFAKLRLKQKKLLPKKARFLISTSGFHAVRALNVFRKVFGPDYAVAVLPIKTIFDDERRLKRVEHELKSDKLSSLEIFSLADFLDLKGGAKEVSPGNEITLLFQMILHHNLYRYRFDLIRKYADVIQAGLPA